MSDLSRHQSLNFYLSVSPLRNRVLQQIAKKTKKMIRTFSLEVLLLRLRNDKQKQQQLGGQPLSFTSQRPARADRCALLHHGSTPADAGSHTWKRHLARTPHNRRTCDINNRESDSGAECCVKALGMGEMNTPEGVGSVLGAARSQ